MDYKVGQADVIFVCGKICSGKDTFADQLAFHEKIVVSDIVRDLIKSTDRKKLADTKALDKKIAKELFDRIKKAGKASVVGVRQLSILLKLKFHLQTNGFSHEYIWLEVSDEELKRRFITRDDEKDKTMTFEEALQKDEDLGLVDLEDWLTYQSNVQVIYND